MTLARLVVRSAAATAVARLSEEATATMRGAWEASHRSLANAGVRTTIMANQLVDMEWKFGVRLASAGGACPLSSVLRPSVLAPLLVT